MSLVVKGSDSLLPHLIVIPATNPTGSDLNARSAAPTNSTGSNLNSRRLARRVEYMDV